MIPIVDSKQGHSGYVWQFHASFRCYPAGTLQGHSAASLVPAHASNDAQAEGLFDRRACENQCAYNTMLVTAQSFVRVKIM